MSQSTNLPMDGYIIFRDVQPGQVIDATTPLGFFPPKDSDELFDALRFKYPHLRSHSERMREAVIEFYLQELPMDALSAAPMPEPVTSASTNTSPWQASIPSFSSESSTWSSPDTLALATPTFSNSPAPQRTRQFSTASSSVAPPSESSPPTIERMTNVFSLSDAAQPKQRIRRKMTEAEKVEYRKRRIVKACDKCAKRKRKCHHNQPEMEAAPTSTKITKPASISPTSRRLPSLPKIQEQQDPLPGDLDFELQQLGELFPDVDLDNLLQPSDIQWPWTDMPDFTLMDTSSSGSDANTPQSGVLEQEYDRLTSNTPFFNELWPMPDHDYNMRQLERPRDSSYSDGANGTLRVEREQIDIPQPTHNLHVHDSELGGQFIALSDSSRVSRERDTNSMAYDDLSYGWNNHQSLDDPQFDTNANGNSDDDNAMASTSRDMLNERSIRHQYRLNMLSATAMSDKSRHTPPTPSPNIPQPSDPDNRQVEDSPARGLNMNRAPGSSGRMLQDQHSSSSQGTLGEGITSSTNPSSELFLLRRRIPKAMHSIVDRNNATANAATNNSRVVRDALLSGAESSEVSQYPRASMPATNNSRVVRDALLSGDSTAGPSASMPATNNSRVVRDALLGGETTAGSSALQVKAPLEFNPKTWSSSAHHFPHGADVNANANATANGSSNPPLLRSRQAHAAPTDISSVPITVLSEGSTSTIPAHTRARHPSASGYSEGTTDARLACTSNSLTRTPTTHSADASGLVGSSQQSLTRAASNSSSDSTNQAHTQSVLFAQRLSDHVRYRDHFGRLTSSQTQQGAETWADVLTYVLVGLFTLCALALGGANINVTLSALLLASVAPVRSASKVDGSAPRSALSRRCDSAWFAGMDFRRGRLSWKEVDVTVTKGKGRDALGFPPQRRAVVACV